MTETRRHAIISIVTTATSALTMIIGFAIQITALTVSASRTTASDVGLGSALLGLIALASSTPHALHTLYMCGHDRGYITQAEHARYDVVLPRSDTADVVRLGARAKP